MKHRNWIALLAALALTASLLAGCGGPKDPVQQPPAPDPAPAEGENLPASDPGPLPSKEEPPEETVPAEEPPAEGEEPSEPGSNSTFEIPVSAFDAPLPVIADTVAMSEPHEVEYTLCFDSSTLQKQ